MYADLLLFRGLNPGFDQNQYMRTLITFMDTYPETAKFKEKFESHFYMTTFDPIKDYNIEFIFRQLMTTFKVIENEKIAAVSSLASKEGHRFLTLVYLFSEHFRKSILSLWKHVHLPTPQDVRFTPIPIPQNWLKRHHLTATNKTCQRMMHLIKRRLCHGI